MPNMFRGADAIAAAMPATDAEAMHTIADASVTEKTRAGYTAAVSKLNDVARRAGFKDGMSRKTTFLRFLAALLNTDRGGTSSATYYRSAMAWHQLRESLPRWALDDDVKDAAEAVAYAARKQTKPRGALTFRMLVELRTHFTDEECRMMIAVHWSCGLRAGQLEELKVDCLVDNFLLLEKDKRFKRKGSVVTEVHWKPLDERGVRVVTLAAQRAREQGRGDRDKLFGTALPRYREKFAEAVKSAGFADLGLDFVPHSARHGFVSHTTAALIPPALQARLGMAAGTVRRYAETNVSRLKRARPEGA